MIDLDADLFFRNKEVAWREACQFVGSLRWINLDLETVMDVGCGNGQNSTRILLDGYQELEKIIAIDNDEHMIRRARASCSNPKISFDVADVQNDEAMRRYENTMTRVISIHCFHWLRDPAQALRNIHRSLVPGGRAAILSVLNAHNWEVHASLQSGKWNSFMQNVPIEFSENQFEETEYRRLLDSIGFDVEVCEVKDVCFTFQQDAMFKDFLLHISPLTKYIPDERKAEFAQDLYTGMVERCGRYGRGRKDFSYMSLRLVLRKK